MPAGTVPPKGQVLRAARMEPGSRAWGGGDGPAALLRAHFCFQHMPGPHRLRQTAHRPPQPRPKREPAEACETLRLGLAPAHSLPSSSANARQARSEASFCQEGCKTIFLNSSFLPVGIREGKPPAQGHTARKRQAGLGPRALAPQGYRASLTISPGRLEGAFSQETCE